VTVEIRTAADVLTGEGSSGLAARRTQRDDVLLREIWRRFVDSGGPVALESLRVALPDLGAAAVRARAAALDEADLIGLDGEEIRLAYPFTAEPNVFEVVLGRKGVRYACCAIDALGIAPMLDAAVTVRSRCHWTGEPLVFEVDPAAGPRSALPGMVVWVERGRAGGDRRSGFL
jgi:hypothetical protein